MKQFIMVGAWLLLGLIALLSAWGLVLGAAAGFQ